MIKAVKIIEIKVQCKDRSRKRERPSRVNEGRPFKVSGTVTEKEIFNMGRFLTRYSEGGTYCSYRSTFMRI